MIIGYCVKCKSKREIKDGEEITMKAKGGKTRPAYKGICAECGTKMFKIMPTSKAPAEPIVADVETPPAETTTS